MNRFSKGILLICTLLGSTQTIADVVDNEIIILIDSSGSLYDPDYARWNAILDVAEYIVTETGSGNAHGVGIFSGCSAAFTTFACANNSNRLGMDYGLHDGAIDPFTDNPIQGDQSAGAVASYLSGLGPSDFLGGFSWYDEALAMALHSFQNSSNTVTGSRYLFFLTDGQDATLGHSPADENGYRSDALIDLLALDVDINAVEFGPDADYGFLRALTGDTDNVFSGTDFASLDLSEIVTTPVVATPAPLPVSLLALGLLGAWLRRALVR